MIRILWGLMRSNLCGFWGWYENWGRMRKSRQYIFVEVPWNCQRWVVQPKIWFYCKNSYPKLDLLWGFLSWKLDLIPWKGFVTCERFVTCDGWFHVGSSPNIFSICIEFYVINYVHEMWFYILHRIRICGIGMFWWDANLGYCSDCVTVIFKGVEEIAYKGISHYVLG